MITSDEIKNSYDHKKKAVKKIADVSESTETAGYLLPCPFCGEKEDITIMIEEYTGGCEEIKGHVFAYVECLPCDAKSGHCFEADAKYSGLDSAKHMAITAWNRRAR